MAVVPQRGRPCVGGGTSVTKIEGHPVIEDYLDDVCSRVKARELHNDIKQEMRDHLDELMSSKREEGLDEEAAARWAVGQMGDAESVGVGLNQVHKPRIPWGLACWVTVLLIMSLVAMYAVELSYAATPGRKMFSDLLFRNALFMAAGLVVMGTLVFFDYRKLLHYCWFLYWATVLISIGAIMFGQQVNGLKSYISFGPFSINWTGVSPFLFIVSAAGVIHSMEETRRSAWIQAALFIAVPAFLYGIAPNLSSLFFYTFAYLILVYSARKSFKDVLLQVPLFAVPAALLLLRSQYSWDRIAVFFRRQDDPLGRGYIYVQIDEAIRSAGWWGHGWAAVNNKLPDIHSSTVITYLIYSLGWVVGGIIVACFLFFIIQSIHILLQVRDRFGKMLISGMAGLIGFQLVWSLGLSLGVLPFVGLATPFLSYGGSHLLVELAVVGLIISIYRRKDMIRVRL